MTAPSLAIVVPTLNEAAALETFLAGLLHQKGGSRVTERVEARRST